MECVCDVNIAAYVTSSYISVDVMGHMAPQRFVCSLQYVIYHNIYFYVCPSFICCVTDL